MYVNPFWVGVAATLIAETFTLFVAAAVLTHKKKKALHACERKDR